MPRESEKLSVSQVSQAPGGDSDPTPAAQNGMTVLLDMASTQTHLHALCADELLQIALLEPGFW